MRLLRAISVVIDIQTRGIDRPFTYAVPETWDDAIPVGAAVLVDFAGRPAVGYVVEADPELPGDIDLKPVKTVLSPPLFDSTGAELARWIAREYVSSLADAMRLLLPPGGRSRAIKTAEGWRLDSPQVQALERVLVTAVPECGFTPRASARAQKAVLDALSDGPVYLTELRAELGEVSSAVKRLAEAGAVTTEIVPRRRAPAGAPAQGAAPAALTAAQESALDAISGASSGSVIVLDGVTGSGKTEVYLRAISETLDRGRGAIVLVPEISLTPQTVGRFRARFGDRVAVLHSRLSAGERYDEWNRVLTGEADVVVGARSALFAPMRDVGIVVIDEEHESSYKQGSAPRYHARDTAVVLARLRGSVLVLGSATPSLEAMSMCRSGVWSLARLPERVTGAPMPEVTVVDMGAEFREGHRSMFSRPLLRELKVVEESRGKAILLLNRRGYASFLLCRECGFVPECDQCSTSMTYHERANVLACHHCDARRPVPSQCPQCSGPYLRVVGAGTQRVESELAALFTDLPVLRMDADTTTTKGAHERILSEFASLETGVLVGTQMIAKGLDFPDVGLVGVLNADLTLHLPDFRAAEKTFQLVSQVAGRAGRGADRGRVIVQTYWPTHPSIRAAEAHDSQAFYDHEMQARAELGYPPLGRMANVTVSSHDDQEAERVAQTVAAALSSAAPDDWRVLGPSRAPLARLRGSYRWHVLVKTPAGADVGPWLRCSTEALRPPSRVTVAIDVDPSDVL